MSELQELLAKRSTKNYRKAAKIIRKERLADQSEPLYSYLKEIISNERQWETSCELIETLGVVQYQPLLDLIHPIIAENKDHDMVTMKAATALVRISREDKSDVSKVLQLLTNTGYAKKEGTLEALGYDQMVPGVEQQAEIIKLCWDFGKDRGRGFSDPRYGLAAACAGWESEKVKPFLENCLEVDDVPLNYVVKNSLKGKYVKLR